ncbi:host attachment protein [Bradyrhizobium sp. Tv2a-2]|uniref:baeRF12 domain-containing protein n=1 Tax=Bradyrhizobium sp. Tv2a-2 TaxID=113395 RepID=UPI000A04AB72|nr:host attachment protein [Bradyrhizobium sp. Tv2a-2]
MFNLLQMRRFATIPQRCWCPRRLNKLGGLDGTIEDLVVVSDPRTLGEMRKHFHRDLRGKIIGEFAKDFSRRSLDDIASLIAVAAKSSSSSRLPSGLAEPV